MRPGSDKVIRLRGVRQNNLKNFDLDLPCNKLVVVTGLSGSGKSSLAFETLYAEGQRRYIETFSPYARQFFDRMDKPKVDSIQGIPPAIALEQTNSVKTTRSTVGTMTEITDYMKTIWPRLAKLFCRGCGRPVQKESPAHVAQDLIATHPGEEAILAFELPLSDKVSLPESIGLVQKQGFQRAVRCEGDKWSVVRLEELLSGEKSGALPSLMIVQDRAKLAPENRARLCEAAEQAYHFGKGHLTAFLNSGVRCEYSNKFHCARCDIEYREATATLFSFNHPVGACPTCRGFGRVISIDYNLAIPEKSLTLAEGAVKPWQSGSGQESQGDLLKFCRRRNVPTDVPFNRLASKHQEWVLNGDPDYGSEPAKEWPNAWYGVRGYFKWLESKAYKMHVRVLLARYRAYTECPDCKGKRFKPESLAYRVVADQRQLTLADFYQLSVAHALSFVEQQASLRPRANDPIALCLDEVRSRLAYLKEAGLGYLTLDRPTRSLSGGETERVNLTTCLGARLVNTLFVLDEPSVGLHARDTTRLVQILERLRDAGNTIVVVEHEAAVMRAADQILDLGPGHGETGGHLLFQGSYNQILKSKGSLTGEYLSGRKQIPLPARRPVKANIPSLRLQGVTRHNLKNVAVDIPLGRFVCVTGVSGSGKSTLIREELTPLLQAKLAATAEKAGASTEAEDASSELASVSTSSGSIAGWEPLGQVIAVDQSCLGRTPRSNPAVYTGAFEHLRKLFAQSERAQQQGLSESAFSFNSAEGQCQRCKGAGFEKIEMQFLSDVYIRCPDCQGRRYRPHILEIAIQPNPTLAPLSIGGLLEATVDDAAAFLDAFLNNRHAARARTALRALEQVGLGYLRLGQPINTLSGGECQRLKLASYLAVFKSSKEKPKPTLFIFDEPTTGLHFEDVRILLGAFQELVDGGHSLIVIEHNLDVIKCADWVIDLGPEAGDDGGKVVGSGTPEAIAALPGSHTGPALKPLLA
ncbi:MAG TPA: excinuclease ABC subunit UvrA [Methylomirabilota bacterium]|nr:excinuclease ABC subunit UvrA [Methylomirabilota bacterium]